MILTILKIIKAIAGLGLLAFAILLIGCGQSDSTSDYLRVGVIAGPEAEIMKLAAELAKKNHDIDVKLVEFSDYVSPNVALADGSIDVNAFQHLHYLESMVRDRGFKLVAVGNTFVYPIAAYSKKIKDIKELKDGAKVAIPNDPTNEGRALILLDKSGLIKLKNSNNLEATVTDIVKNPRRLKFIELDVAQMPRSMDDVDIAFINNTYSVPAGYIPTRDALLIEDKDSPYVNVIVTREENKEDPRVMALVRSYHSDEVEAKAEELFKGSSIAGWK